MKLSLEAVLCGLAAITFHISLSEAAPTQNLPTVDLGYSVHQATINSSGQYPYLNFSNIRYGQPPVGPLRFSAPLCPTGRNDTVNNGQQGVICPQADPAWFLTAGEFITALLTGQNTTQFTNPQKPAAATNFSLPTQDPRTSEDCLFLDVIVPTQLFNSSQSRTRRGVNHRVCTTGSPCRETQAGAPVLVWIYGGGYTGGEKTSTGNPASLLASSQQDGGEGVVYVALNYRLGLFGWISGSDEVTANAGLLDQRLALEWVQENIHKFGGDPSRVTIMGESAGAGSIMHQITAYGGEGSVPFQQAIPQSPAFQPIIPVQSKAFFSQILGNASLITNRTITSANQLRTLPYEALQAINTIVTGLSSYGSFTFGPVVSGENSFVPDFPIRLLANGAYHNVSVLVGHNSDEGLLFTPPFVQSQSAYVASVASLFPAANSSVIAEITDVLYPPVFNGSYGYTNQLERTALTVGDFSINCNAHVLASVLPSAYAYLFSVPPGLHGQDIAYTFFNGDTSTSDEGGPVIAQIADPFQRYLTSFAMTGTPGFGMYGANESVTNINVTGFGMQMRDPAARSQCKFWSEAPYYL